jgi:hypothetical protein
MPLPESPTAALASSLTSCCIYGIAEELNQMGIARLSLYLIGIAAGVAAIVMYRNRPATVRANPDSRLPSQKAADILREASANPTV